MASTSCPTSTAIRCCSGAAKRIQSMTTTTTTSIIYFIQNSTKRLKQQQQRRDLQSYLVNDELAALIVDADEGNGELCISIPDTHQDKIKSKCFQQCFKNNLSILILFTKKTTNEFCKQKTSRSTSRSSSACRVHAVAFASRPGRRRRATQCSL